MFKKFDPYSKNIIFLDTEFSSLNPTKGELLSIGLVKLNGQELYLELKHTSKVDGWVKKNILPNLKIRKYSKKEAVKKIKRFVGPGKPYCVSYVNTFDSLFIYKLFGTNNHPFFWIPIDFASVLFSLKIAPTSYYTEDNKNFFKKIGVNAKKYKRHHALDDAKLLREVYLKMIK